MTREDACRVLEMDPSASLEEAKMAWRDLVSVWHPDRRNGNERLRRKAEEKTKQINEAWETFPTAPRENAKSSASREPNWEDLKEKFRRAQEERQARDKKERKRAESNENQESKKTCNERQCC